MKSLTISLLLVIPCLAVCLTTIGQEVPKDDPRIQKAIQFKQQGAYEKARNLFETVGLENNESRWLHEAALMDAKLRNSNNHCLYYKKLKEQGRHSMDEETLLFYGCTAQTYRVVQYR